MLPKYNPQMNFNLKKKIKCTFITKILKHQEKIKN